MIRILIYVKLCELCVLSLCFLGVMIDNDVIFMLWIKFPGANTVISVR